MINVTNGKLIRLLVDDEPFDVRYGTLVRHERVLDLRDGVLRREVEWVSPAGPGRARALDAAGLVRPALGRGDPLRGRAAGGAAPGSSCSPSSSPTSPCPGESDDPRAAAALRAPLESEDHGHHDLRAGADPPHAGERPADGGGDGPRARRRRRTSSREAESEADLARVTVSDGARARPDAARRASSSPTGGRASARCPSLRDQVEAALASARRTGWDGLCRGQREYLDDFWARADIELDGDPALQQAVRFALFQVLQAGARAEQRAIPAKGLTGQRLRRPLVLGHGDLHAAGADLHRARAPRATRCTGATRRWIWPPSGRASSSSRASPSRGGRSAARSAPATGRRARRRSTSTPTSPTPSAATSSRPATRSSSGARGSSCWWRRRGCGARSATTTRTAASASTASPGPTSTRRWSTTTSTRTSWRRATCASPPTSPCATRARAAALDVDEEEIAAWRDAAGAMVIPFDDGAAGHAAVRTASRATRDWDFEATPEDELPAAAALPVLPALLEPGGQAGRPGVRALRLRRRTSTPSRSSATSTTTSASPCATRRCRPRSRRSWPPRSAISSSPTTTSARPPSSTCATSPSTRATACTSRRSRAPGWSPSPASAACATTATRCSFAPRLPPRLTRLTFRLVYRGRRLRVRDRARASHLRAARRRRAGAAPPRRGAHGGARRPQTRPLPPLRRRARPEQPPGGRRRCATTRPET